MKRLYERLGVSKQVIDDVKESRQKKEFTKFSDSAPPIPNYNLMMDLIELPTATQGYKYLLVVVDIAGNGHFDIEPLKTKTTDACLKGLKKIFNREYIHIPYFSVITDAGSEFKGRFNDFLKEHGIYHKVSTPKRKTQNSVVESLNRVLGRVIFAYLNQKEIDTNKVYKNWLPIVPIIRQELNEFRKKKIEPYTLDTIPPLDLDALDEKPKFKVNDRVQYRLDEPKTFLGKKNSGGFREGDVRFSSPTRITQVLIYHGNQPYRYLVESNTHASYTDNQLRKVR